jgi:hypothetical protein
MFFQGLNDPASIQLVPRCRSACAAVLILVGSAAAAADAPPAPGLNEAQRLVFMNDSLRDLSAGSVLIYDFSHKDKETKGFSDRVKLTVTRVLGDGKRDLTFDFLTGNRHVAFHPAAAYKGNPVPIQFLERDVDEMARSVDGRAGYFQSRIRRAFFHPQVRPVKISFQGKEVNGVEVSVAPFVNDPNIERFRAYAHKQYEFLFSDQVPGGLYRIRTVVPGEKDATPVIEEDLTFSRLTSTEDPARSAAESAAHPSSR